MRKCSGMTLIELVLATALSALIIGAVASLYAFVVIRSGGSGAHSALLLQSRRVLQDITDTVRNSVNCQVVTAGGNTGLKCILPVRAVDLDGDGVADRYDPNIVTGFGIPRYGTTGARVWFYRASASGNFTSPGNILYRAVRFDDALPTGTDVDKKWTYYYSTGPSQTNLIDTLTFTVDSTQRLTTITLTASVLTREERSAQGEPVSSAYDRYTLTLTEKAFWRHWKQ